MPMITPAMGMAAIPAEQPWFRLVRRLATRSCSELSLVRDLALLRLAVGRLHEHPPVHAELELELASRGGIADPHAQNGPLGS